MFLNFICYNITQYSDGHFPRTCFFQKNCAVMWSDVKCSDVRWNWAVGNLSGVKPKWNVVGWSLNERKWSVEKCSEVEWSVAEWSAVKWSGVLSIRVSTIIRIYLYIDHMKFAGYMAYILLSHCFIFLWFHRCIYIYINVCVCVCVAGGLYVYIILFNFVNDAFLIYAYCIKSWEPLTPGTLRACQGLSEPVKGLLYLYVFLLLCLRVCIVMYVPFCLFCFIVLFVYCLCANVYCTTVTQCKPNCG
jgi:hypothetical protein